MIFSIGSTAGQIGPFWWVNQHRSRLHNTEVPGLCGVYGFGEDDTDDEEPEEQGDEWLSWSMDYDR